MPSSAASRDLPPFPTRRSSDLRRRAAGRRPDRGVGARLVVLARPVPGARLCRQVGPDRLHPLQLAGRGRPADQGAERAEVIRHPRSEEHTSELQSLTNLVCRLLPPPAIYPLSLHDALPIYVAARLADAQIGVWAHDSWYSLGLYQGLGYADKSVRIGFIHYNSPDEVDRLIKALNGLRLSATPDRKSTRLNSSH